MTGREKPKRKALHRGLDDIIRRDASLTSRLLGRVNPVVRESLDIPPSDSETSNNPSWQTTSAPSVARQESNLNTVDTRSAPTNRGQMQTVSPLVSRKEASSPEKVEDHKPIFQRPRTPSASSQIDLHHEKATIAPERSHIISLEEFVLQWGFFLKSGNRNGKMRICEVLYNNTYALDKETYFTSYEKLAKVAGLEKRQCAINIRQLEDLGFVERLNIYNTATRQGTEFKLHLSQLPPQSRRTPQHHHYDEETKR